MWIFDSKTLRFLAVNDAAIDCYGYSREEFLAMSIADIRPADEVDPLLRFLDRSQPELGAPATWRHRTKNGDVLDVEVTTHALDRNGRSARLAIVNDVTLRERTKRALEASERKFRGLFEASPDAIMIASSSDGRYVAVNPRWTELSGYCEADAIGRTASELDLWVEEEIYSRVRRDVAEAGGTMNVEAEMRRRDGTIVPVSLSVVPLHFDGKAHVVGFVREMTAQKRAEQALRDHAAELWVWKRRHDAVAMASGRVLLIWDAVNDRLEWSGPYREVLGYERLPGDAPNAILLIHPDDRPGWRAALAKSLATRSPLHRTFRLRHADGSYRIVEEHAYFVDPGSEGRLEMIGSIVDVTERHAAEAEILRSRAQLADALAIARDSEERFRQLADNSTELFWLAAADFTQFLYLSPAIEKIWGLSAEAVHQDPRVFFTLLHPDDRAPVAQAAARSAAGEAIDIEVRIEHGTTHDERWLWIRTFPIRDAAGKVYRVAGLSADVTERKRMEAALRDARDRALDSDRLKTAFLANVSHEIRTPLNVILGFGSLVADRLAEIGDHSQDSHLAGIERASKRLLTTIQSILDLARFQADDFELSPTSIDLSELVAGEIAAFATKKPGVRLVSDLATKAVVRFDAYCLRQSLNHLVDNAFKFTDRGEVAVRLRAAADGAIELEVSDTGIGIDQRFLSRLFDPFCQEDAGHTRRFEGSGIGLTLVKRYLEQNGARVDVKSEKGRGSTFRIVFPPSLRVGGLEDGPRAPTVGAKGNSVVPMFTSPPKPTIVVVEDDPATQALMRSVLGRRYAVLAAASGEELRETLRRHRSGVDLALMDLSLKGGEDGLALTRWLRAQPATRDLPIIAVTAHAFDEHRTAALEAGCDTFVLKPVRPREILAEIDKLLGRKPTRRMPGAMPRTG